MECCDCFNNASGKSPFHSPQENYSIVMETIVVILQRCEAKQIWLAKQIQY